MFWVFGHDVQRLGTPEIISTTAKHLGGEACRRCTVAVQLGIARGGSDSPTPPIWYDITAS